jgi:alcohol dehydrogenase (NADP+)
MTVRFWSWQGIHVTAYSPLGSPDSATMSHREDAPELLKDPVVNKIAEKLGKHPAQVSARFFVLYQRWYKTS